MTSDNMKQWLSEAMNKDENNLVFFSTNCVHYGGIYPSDIDKAKGNNDISSLSLCLRVNYDFPINHHTLHNAYH